MRRPNQPAPKARRGVMALLLLLVVSAVFVVRQRAVISAPTASGGRHATSAALGLLPPARINTLRESAAQGIFTLASISRGADSSFVPPPEVPIFPMGVAGTNDGTGLWIKVNGGTGVRTFSLTPGRHEWPFGAYTLVTTLMDPTMRLDGGGAISIEWFRTGSPTPLPPDQAPFSILASMQRGSAEGDRQPVYQVLPRDWSRLYQITAQPKRHDGTDAGGPVSLTYAPCGEDTLFVHLPAGYSPTTESFDISLSDRHLPQPNRANWHLTNLPKMEADAVHGKPATRWTLNGVPIEATVREVKDQWGWKTTGESPFLRIAKSFNVDAHGWTGAPTLRCQLRVLPVALKPGEQWEVQVRDARPQWAPSLKNVGDPLWLSHLRMLPGNLPVRPPDPEVPKPSRNVLDFTCGVAYPGQQKYLQVKADVVRFAVSSEPVTFTNADLVQNPRTHQSYLVWQQAQTRTTASGLLLSTLNPRQGVTQDPLNVIVPADREFPLSSFEMFWSYYRSLHPANSTVSGAEMRLAWHMPTVLTTPLTHQANTSAQLSWMGVSAPLRLLSGPQVARTWLGSALPGVPAPPLLPRGLDFGTRRRIRTPTPLDALKHHNFQPIALMVGSATGSPLPRHLDSVTVLVRTRIPVEQHSYTLLVPVTPEGQTPTEVTPQAAPDTRVSRVLLGQPRLRAQAP